MCELLRPGKTWRMFAFIAALLFAIATLIAFTALNGVSVTGLIAAGLLCLTLHLIVPGTWGPSWMRRA